MHEFIEAPDDVLALTIRDRVTRQDLDPIMDRLDASMDKHDRVHVFVETHAISGFDWGAMPGYMARAVPLLAKLNRFGRVAVVADQERIRTWTRVESAILPFISYRTFEPDERAKALDWVLTGKDS